MIKTTSDAHTPGQVLQANDNDKPAARPTAQGAGEKKMSDEDRECLENAQRRAPPGVIMRLATSEEFGRYAPRRVPGRKAIEAAEADSTLLDLTVAAVRVNRHASTAGDLCMELLSTGYKPEEVLEFVDQIARASEAQLREVNKLAIAAVTFWSKDR